MTEKNNDLRNYIDLRIATEREYISGIEKRLDEKFAHHDSAAQKDAKIIDDRLARVSAFRDQIIAERGSYVTKDHLDVAMKGLNDQVDILSRAITLSAGKEVGVSKTWQIIVTIFAVAGTVGTVINAAATVFFR